MLALALIFAQVAAGAGGGGWSSARPPECGSLDGGRASNVWERAKAPELRRYCDLLASGASKLASSAAMVREVLSIADEAERAMPGRAGPGVLRGRALLRLGRADDALAAFRDAKAKDERALDDPASLLSWARVLGKTGNTAEAAEAYRALLPRVSTLTVTDRGAAAVEAGLLALGRGQAGAEDAIAILRQARRDSQDVTQALAVILLALALDRAGERDEANAVLLERGRGDPRPILADARVKDILSTVSLAAEGYALAAIALESSDGPAAREQWHKYVEASPKSPWLEHARVHEGSPTKKPVHGATR